MPPESRIPLVPGTTFSIPLLDTSFGTGLILQDPGGGLLTSVFLDQYSARASGETPWRANAIAFAHIWREAFYSKRWIAVAEWSPGPRGFERLEDLLNRFPLPATVRRLNETLVEDLLAAYDGTRAWNEWEPEDFMDSLLAPGVSRPKWAKLWSAAERRGRARTAPRIT